MSGGLFRVSVGQHGALPAWPVYACKQFPLLKQGSQMPWTWLSTEKLPHSMVSSRDANHLQWAMLPVCSVLGLSLRWFGPCWRRGCHLAQCSHSITSSAVPRGWPYKPQRETKQAPLPVFSPCSSQPSASRPGMVSSHAMDTHSHASTMHLKATIWQEAAALSNQPKKQNFISQRTAWTSPAQ